MYVHTSQTTVSLAKTQKTEIFKRTMDHGGLDRQAISQGGRRGLDIEWHYCVVSSDKNISHDVQHLLIDPELHDAGVTRWMQKILAILAISCSAKSHQALRFKTRPVNGLLTRDVTVGTYAYYFFSAVERIRLAEQIIYLAG
jgi:hypothetical protein